MWMSYEELVADATSALPERLFTVPDLAAMCQTTEWFIRAEVRRGHLRGVHVGKRLLRFKPSDVDAWIEASSAGVSA